MNFDDLTPEQQAIIREFVTQFRAGMGDLARALRLVNGLGIAFQTYATLFASLDPDTVLPSNSGLAGIGPVTVSDILTTMQDVQMVAAYDTPSARQNFVRYAGINALM